MRGVNRDLTQRMSRYRDDSKCQKREDPREPSGHFIRGWTTIFFTFDHIQSVFKDLRLTDLSVS
jgi:hypothetical protein